MKATSPAARKSVPNKKPRYWLAGFVCLALLLFGPRFTPTNPWQSVLEPVPAIAQNRTGFDLDAFREEFDKDGDGEVDAPDEAANEPDAADQPDEAADAPGDDEADEGSDDGDDNDDRDFESDGEEDAPDHANFDDDRDGDADGKYDLDEGEAPDFAGVSRTNRTTRNRRPAALNRLGLLNELTPLPNK
jgi:hypothetical protein